MHPTWCDLRPMVCACTVSIAAVALEAQSSSFTIGPGVSIPTGGYGSTDSQGWHVLGAADVPSPVANFRYRFDGMYSVTTHRGGGGHTAIAGASASLVWLLRPDSPTLRPYLLMGIGVYDVTTTAFVVVCNNGYCGGPTSQTRLAWIGGGGVEVPRLGPATGFVEARYLTIRTSGTPTNVLTATLGLVFGAP
jgi:hypothetical protein